MRTHRSACTTPSPYDLVICEGDGMGGWPEPALRGGQEVVLGGGLHEGEVRATWWTDGRMLCAATRATHITLS